MKSKEELIASCPIGADLDSYLHGYTNGYTDKEAEEKEVDLENYLENYFKGWHIEEEIGLTKPDGWSCIVKDLKGIARHFYNLGLNSKK